MMNIWRRYTGALAGLSLLLLCLFPSILAAATGQVADNELNLGADAQVAVLTGEAAGEGSHDGHGGALSQGKLQDFGWRIVNFIALLIILVWCGAKPLGKTLSSRRQQIVSEIDELEQRKAAAQKTYQQLQGKLAGVEADIDKIVERAIAQADMEKVRILEKAEAAAEEMKRSAEQAIQNEVAEARKVLREEIAEKAAVMAEEIITRNLKASDQKILIENYLAKVEAMP